MDIDDLSTESIETYLEKRKEKETEKKPKTIREWLENAEEDDKLKIDSNEIWCVDFDKCCVVNDKVAIVIDKEDDTIFMADGYLDKRINEE